MTSLLRSGALVALLLAPSWAQAQIGELDNQCIDAGGVGTECTTDDTCAPNAYATLCVKEPAGSLFAKACQIPCGDNSSGTEIASQNACALGETCVQAADDQFFCEPVSFRMDLNLLDQCITKFVTNEAPSLGSTNACSLEANLNKLLDQDSDFDFDIFDVELCIRDFLQQPSCTDAVDCATKGLVHCTTDEDCGKGLHCDTDRNACQRECGFIESRQPGFGVLERQCAGALKTCDFDRGNCVDADIENATCAVDSECPSGAYCFLGRCAPNCFRSVDCPDSRWYCTTNNSCRALPSPDASDGFVFDPANYTVLFARDGLVLNEIDDTQFMPVLVMDLITKKEVRTNPSVSFGFRVEVAYDLKQDPKCLQPLGQLSDEDAQDCIVDPQQGEAWITALNPFGTIFAVGDPRIDVGLDSVAADSLTPGLYTATVKAIFDNGNSSEFKVSYVKSTPSGRYVGDVSIYLEDPEYLLTSRQPLNVSMQLYVSDQTTTWEEFLLGENLDGEEDIRDITSGFVVHGYLDANESLLFAAPNTTSRGLNQIPVKGLYSPDLGRLRVMANIELTPDHCISEVGDCADATETDLQVQNIFARRIRRLIQMVGPFDTATGRFSGIYREKISGLVPLSDITLDGGFVLDQVAPDETEILLTQPLLSDADRSSNPIVEFPDSDAVFLDVADSILGNCGGLGGSLKFASASAYSNYVAANSPIFSDVVEFKDLIQDGLDALSSQDVAALTIYEYLQGRIVPCDANADPEPLAGATPPACVDTKKLSCGLARYRLAALAETSGTRWVDVAGLADNPDGELELFCRPTLPVPGCDFTPSDNPALFTLHEHNRFHQELSQALKFEADRGLSDAFLTLHRNAVNPFAAGAAQSFKENALREAVTNYDQLVDLIADVQSAAILFQWPMAAFKTQGKEWLDQMQTILSDRLEALAQLVDLKRRKFINADDQDYMWAQHMVQQEYLLQVYLLALQRQWQGATFFYEGDAGRVLEEGQSIIQQLDSNRNPLGIAANRVYFETRDPEVKNWRNYQELLAGEGGLIERGRAEVDAAVQNLKDSLRDVDALEDAIFESVNNLEDQLIDYCGDGTERCSALYNGIQASIEEYEQIRECRFRNIDSTAGTVFSTDPDNLSCPDTAFSCVADAAAECKSVVSAFASSNNLFVTTTTDTEIGNTDYIGCEIENTPLSITTSGGTRVCSGGRLGSLMQERAALNLRRRQVVDDVQTLLGKLGDLQQAFETIKSNNSEAKKQGAVFIGIRATVQTIQTGLETARDLITNISDAPKCFLILGFSNGTNCPGSFLKLGTLAGNSIYSTFIGLLDGASDVFDALQDQVERLADAANDEEELKAQSKTLQRDIDDLTAAYETVTQEMFTLEFEIDQTVKEAQRVADRAEGEIGLIADHLIGRETGNVLLGDLLVSRSNETFREILEYTFRMTMAFSHRYNLSVGEESALLAQVFNLQTLDDVSEYVIQLEDFGRDYCGREGLDCDSYNNIGVLRVSMRDELFPQLRDIVDARTGQVVTAGEQFHNIITSPPFLKRRVRGVETVDQIELTFATWLSVLGDGDDRKFMIDPLECNHLMDGDPGELTSDRQGSLAVNFVGRNLSNDGGLGLRYEMIRGAIDYQRGCRSEVSQEQVGDDPVVTYPIRTKIVGYAPQNTNAGLANPPSFVTRSSRLPACVNHPESGGNLDDGRCWNLFARDRSLSAPDWRLVVPLRIGGAEIENTWVLGDGLREEERPIIEDVVVYMRYRARPIDEF